MRLVSFRANDDHDGPWRAGVRLGSVVVGAEAAIAGSEIEADLERGPISVRALIGAIGRASDSAAATATVQRGAEQVVDNKGLAVDAITLGPPVPDPDKILCVGLNYVDHASESDLDTTQVPTIFAKFRNSLVGPGAEIVIPAITSEVDYEGEIAVVIGRRGREIPVEDALMHVAGAMPFNDVSARDLQMQTTQWTAGKAIDTFAPCGPELVLMDEIDDLQNLELVTRLNGEVVQQASSADMVHSVAEVISFLSKVMTLEVGDVIATGTPSGVGFVREPPVFLVPRDVVEVEVKGLGLLSSPVAADR